MRIGGIALLTPHFALLIFPESTDDVSISSPSKDIKDTTGGRNPNGVPSPSPTCVECDDYDGDLKASETVWTADTNAESFIVNVAPPSPSPTCVECDDGPKPTRPPSNLPLPYKEDEPTMPDTLLDLKTDGERDPWQDELLHDFGGEDDYSGSETLKVAFLVTLFGTSLLAVTMMI